jgi:hypothetical protein
MLNQIFKFTYLACPLKENEDDDSLSKINITNTVNTSRSEKQQNCSTVLANIRNLTECSQAIDTSTRKDITDLTVGTITSNFSRSSNATESKNSEENPPKFRPNETPTLTGKRPSAQLLVGSLLGPPTPKTPKYQPPNKEEEDEERENNGDPKELEEDFMWRPSISLLPNIAFSMCLLVLKACD